MALIDRDGTVTAANPALVAIIGRAARRAGGCPSSSVHEPGERRVVTADGDTVWVQTRVARLDADGEVVLLVQDITERKRYEGELQYLADHDPLTGLFNRRRFAEELDWVLAYSRRYHSPAALVAIDVDNFKFVNDTFGHATGDELLVAIAAALQARCRDSDIVGRVGGDEFGIVLPAERQRGGRHRRPGAAGRRARRARDGRPARRPRDRLDRRPADRRGHRADRRGDPLRRRHRALRRQGERPRPDVGGGRQQPGHRPPQRPHHAGRTGSATRSTTTASCSTSSRSSTSHSAASSRSELLLRMRGDGEQVIAPGEFLDTAERFGQIQAIDRWVLERAVRLLAERQAAGLDLDIEVNLSGGSISDPTVIDFIVSEVRNAPIDPRGADDRGHRDRRDRQHRARPRARPVARRPRLPLRARRLRLRLRLVLLPQAPAVRRRQDRRRVRQGARHEPDRPADRPGDRPDRRRPEQAHDRRVRRERGGPGDSRAIRYWR